MLWEEKSMEGERQKANRENSAPVQILLITANVGSLFEDPTALLQPWLDEFLKKVSELQPQFLALHLQEVGGKTYEKSMEYVQEFIRILCEANEMRDFAFIRIYMDEDFNSAEHFTALGNLYFAHKCLKSVKIWNFLTHDWESAEGKSIYSGNIEAIATKEKSKFPQHFFPECKWSRKGFMRTRWEINCTVIDLVNIHLFHDASNLAACEEFPSVYCKTRRRALVHTLERFHSDDRNGLAPYFVFGDFNFRCDTEGVIKELTKNLTAHRVQSIKSDSTKFHYRNSVGDNVLTIGKKEFNHADHQLKFKEAWLKRFDRELEALGEILIEYPIDFPPSYPYEEDLEMPTDYMSTRCPSWCDRILMSPQTKEIILDDDDGISRNNPYNIIGENVCMGDHKPIYLNIRLKANQGTYRCCKCYLNNANNNNKSTSLRHDPAAAANSYASYAYCPYKSHAYSEIIRECKHLNTKKISAAAEPKALAVAANSEEQQRHQAKKPPIPHNNLKSCQHVENDDITIDAKCQSPTVSINIIDSDNIFVCMCAQMSSRNDDVANVNDNGSICPECRNIIKKQPQEHRYKLISKRLILSNDIVVNRIDTQYLNAYFDVSARHQQQRRRQDPYTPESAESHSPYPELNSSTTTTTTTSSHSRSPCEINPSVVLSSIERQATTDDSAAQPPDNIGRADSANELSNSATTVPTNEHGAPFEKQQNSRGFVSPGQLKSRLEDLQRRSSSVQNLNHQLNGSGIAIGAAGGDSDVEDVVYKSWLPPTVAAAQKRRSNSCLPDCCAPVELAHVPENLRRIVSATLGDEVLWKEQSQDGQLAPPSTSVAVRTHYVQINSILNSLKNHPQNIANNATIALNNNADDGIERAEVMKITAPSDGGAILKETTV